MAKQIETLVQKYGTNSNSFLALYPGYHYFYPSDLSEGCVAYVRTKTAWVGIAEPLASEADRLRVLMAFANEARLDGKAAVLLPVEDSFKEEAKLAGFRSLQIGSEPYFNLDYYPAEGRSWFDVSHSAKALKEKGFRVRTFEFETCPHETRIQINQVLKEWRGTRKTGELGFVNRVEPEVLSKLKSHFLVENEGKIWAFLSAIPISPTGGWYFIDVIRRQGAPAGCVELLMLEAMIILKDRGARLISLGVSPLSRAANAPTRAEQQTWYERASTYFFDHAQWFYNFKSLFDFKRKFRPSSWRAAYVIHNFEHTDHRLMKVLLELFLPQGPLKAFVQMIQKKLDPRALVRQAKSWVNESVILRSNPRPDLHLFLRTPCSVALLGAIGLCFLGTVGQGLTLSSYWTHSGAYSFGLFQELDSLSRLFQIFLVPAFLHWNLTHFLFNSLTLFFFGMSLEIYLGSTILLASYFAAVLLSNPLTSLLIWLGYQVTHAEALRLALGSLDVGASLGIWSCAGAWSYLLKSRRSAWLVFTISVVIVAFSKGDLLQTNHIVAAAIGYFTARLYFGDVRKSLS